MLYLHEAGTFFIPSEKGRIPLETDGIAAKAGQKSPYDFVSGWFWRLVIMWLKVAKNAQKSRNKNIWMQLTNRMLNNVWHSFRVLFWIVIEKNNVVYY